MHKVVLFLMGKKGLACLEALTEEHLHYVEAVVFASDKNVAYDYVDEIKSFCQKKNLICYSKKEWETQQAVFTGFGIAVSWRWIITNPSLKLIVLHDSLLPRYRGFNPLVTALINGDEEIGVTALLADKEFDRGDIIKQASFTLHYPITIEQAIESINLCYQELILAIFEKIATGDLTATPQDETKASYSLWRDEEDYFIDWSQDSDRLEREINALGFPYAGARTRMDGEVIILKKVKSLNDVAIANRTPGKILFIRENQPEVVCGKGLLKIIEASTIDGQSVTFVKFRQRFK